MIEELLESYGTPETFEVELPKGEKLTFRHITNFAELSRFKKEANDFARILLSKNCPGPYREHAPNNMDAAIAAYTISTLSVEPRFEHIDALKLMKAPYLVQTILNQIDATRMNYLNEGFAAQVEAEKKDSNETESTETV